MNTTKPTELGPVKTQDELNKIVLEISSKYPDRKILFRGQRRSHETIRSGRARPNIKVHKDIEAGWRSLAMRMLNLSGERNSYGYARAILQHYGMATHFVDLTEDLEVAAWFATKKYNSSMVVYGGSAMRQYEQVLYEQSEEENGYILVFAIAEAEKLGESGRLFDLSKLPVECARPHRQKGWLMLDRPPTQPTPNSFWIATIKVDTKAWTTKFKTTDLFPGPIEDPAFGILLSLPFVQVPTGYFGSDKDTDQKKPKLNEEFEREMETFCFAQRALAIPEYGNEIHNECIDHKWGDFTIYEPHHMRMWKCWRFDLESEHRGITGDIKDAVKITLSPEAKKVLFSVENQKCFWPSLGSDGIFFAFAELDHDKVIDHALPYYGVWLQRDDELIVGSPMEADNDALNVMAGHSYFLRDGILERQVMESSCKCGKPETHDKRVQSVLQLSSLLENGTLILLPHPLMSQLGWHIVITGSEGSNMIPRVESFHKVVRALNKHYVDSQPNPPEAGK